MKTYLLLLSIFLCNPLIAQISEYSGFYFAKEYSKEVSLYRAKAFVMKEIFNDKDDLVQFEIDPLAATTTGEVTSLVYKCESKKVEGLILGFYGNYWNKEGVIYQGYAFKNLQKDKALELLNMISKTIETQRTYLSKDPDNNNVFFKYDDIMILIYFPLAEAKIRLFWGSFDSEWESTAFKRTKRRFEKSIK
jgi:hypothetical protein